jgi:hypothetical protein
MSGSNQAPNPSAGWVTRQGDDFVRMKAELDDCIRSIEAWIASIEQIALSPGDYTETFDSYVKELDQWMRNLSDIRAHYQWVLKDPEPESTNAGELNELVQYFDYRFNVTVRLLEYIRRYAMRGDSYEKPTTNDLRYAHSKARKRIWKLLEAARGWKSEGL